MIVLPIKKIWFDTILSGVKTEEYRDIKPYYDSRFKELVGTGKSVEVLFRNGYAPDSPSFKALCNITIGTGKPAWGAAEGVEYYVLKIEKICTRPIKARRRKKDEEQLCLF